MHEKQDKTKSKKTKKNKTEKPDMKQQLFVMWLCKEYELSYMPKYMFEIINEIEKGEYKNLIKPIPFEDLQDMWQRKLPYLKKVHFRNQCAGKEMRDVAWLKYDLAIVLSKYDDYLSWKEKQLLATSLEDKKPLDDINYTQIQRSIQSEADTQLDISEIINEI